MRPACMLIIGHVERDAQCYRNDEHDAQTPRTGLGWSIEFGLENGTRFLQVGLLINKVVSDDGQSFGE